MARRITLLTLGVVLSWCSSAGAQYFGKNKVRYEDFEFRVLQTPHFDIYHYPEAEVAVGHAAVLAERWYARLARAFDHTFDERQPLVLYASYTHFAQNTVVPGFIPEGVGGVTEHQRGRIVMPFAASLGETNHILGHELVHAFQRDILRAHNRSMALLPLWFLEGMAEYVSAGRIDVNTAMWLRDAVADERLPTLEQLDDPRYFPYRFGQALWAYLAERFGPGIVPRVLASKASGGAIGRIAAETGVDPRSLAKDWHASIRSRYEDTSARSAAPPVISRRAGGGRLNVGPALSPDGADLVFLSERDQYSVDVYLADAATGAVEQRLVQTAADPHFESLQFIGSSGAWNRAGDRFAMAAIHRGQPLVTILEMPSGRTLREIPLPDLDEVFSPSWSPDGTRLAFSALAGGVSDLYIVDIDSGEVRALTADPFADLQPSWSPDGRRIASVTDRFSSSLERLSFGDYRLAIVDVATRAVEELPGLPYGKHINPQWSPDGKSLYFVGDAGQRSNVYRLHIASAQVFRLTDVVTGVSGVTASSPALSVAADGGRLAFNVYRHGAYELHVREVDAGTPLTTAELSGRTAPRPDGATRPTALPTTEPTAFTIRPYEGSLSLDRIGQPYLTAGGGATGSIFRAGMSFGFGDMLGQHALRTAFQVGKSVADLGAQVAYVNQRSRWNWGVVAEQVGSVLGSRQISIAPAAGAPEMTQEEVRVTQIHRGVSGIAMYPFNRALRLELSGGVHAVSYDREAVTSVYSSATGALLSESRDRSAPAAPLLLAQTSAALVHDTALLGPTGPILGTRYRFELAPAFGRLNFATLIADYRRYVMPRRPWTLALRAKHIGRFGADGGDQRLFPLIYSLRDVARGYSTRSLGPGHLLDTRHVSAANAELRVPILGVFTGTPAYGPLPIELFVFGDAARVWSADQAVWLRSAGVGARLNAGGFVFELAGAHRFDSARGWRLAVNLGPSF